MILAQKSVFGRFDARVLNNTTPLYAAAKPFEVVESVDWQPGQSLFVYALTTLPKVRQAMQIFDWGVSVTGRVPERIWKNTEPIIIAYSTVCAAVNVQARSFNPQVRAAELCADRLREVMRITERFAPSYNQILLQGAASYCLRVLSRLDEKKDEPSKQLLARIRKFTNQVESICDQYEKRYEASFSLLNLQVLEDQFDMIQAESAKLRLLPLLRDIPTKELVRP